MDWLEASPPLPPSREAARVRPVREIREIRRRNQITSLALEITHSDAVIRIAQRMQGNCGAARGRSHQRYWK